MTSRLLSAAALAAMLALAACTTPPSAQVARFHTGQPIARGTIAITPADAEFGTTLEFRAQADAVGRELARQGFVIVPDAAHAQYVAVVEIHAIGRAGPPREPKLRIGLGGGFGSGNVGVGSSVSVPVGGQPQGTTLTSTTLSVAIRDRSSNQTLWEGRATAESTNGGGTANVTPLASALFRDFPGNSGQTVKVRL